jgi:cellulose synthase/poly-beta-1,6-N-acetylglucosamine synthase-like glycosyltransferase
MSITGPEKAAYLMRCARPDWKPLFGAVFLIWPLMISRQWHLFRTSLTWKGSIPDGRCCDGMPVYNAGETVGYALHGLLAKTWPNIEIFVIDDGSSDDTCARVNEIAASDSRVMLLRQKENKGAYAARNEGLKHAQGEFIANHAAVCTEPGTQGGPVPLALLQKYSGK